MTSGVGSHARALGGLGLPTGRAGVLGAALAIPLVGLFVGWPLIRLVAALGPPGGPVISALARSVAVASASTVGCVVLALTLGYAAARVGVPGRRVVLRVCLILMVAPPVLAALALEVVLGPTRGLVAVVVAQVLTFLPYAFLLVVGALARLDVALDEVGESLGAGGLTVFRRIALGLLRPRLITATLIVFALALGDFANPFLLAGDQTLLSTLMYTSAVRAADATAAATPAALLLLPGVIAGLVLGRLDADALPLVTPPDHRTAQRPVPAFVRWPLSLVTLGAGIVLVAVPALVVLGSVTERSGWPWRPTLAHWAGLAGPGVSEALATSVGLGVAAGLAGLPLAFAAAHAVRRVPQPLARLLSRITLGALVLPGPAIGVAYLLALAGTRAGTFWILVAAVVFGRLATATRAATVALGRVEPSHEEAAVSLGASVGRTYARVFVPRLGPAAWSLFLFFFVEGVINVGAVVFLARPGVTPGAVALLGAVERGALGSACALAAALCAFVLAALVSARVLAGPGRLRVPGL